MADDKEAAKPKPKPRPRPPKPKQPVAESLARPPEHFPIGKDAKGHEQKPGDTAQKQPTDFDQSLRKTDTTIKWFTVISGLSAAISAAVAFYTGCQIQSTSAQTDAAISQIATLAAQARREADLAADANGETQSIANDANRRTDKVAQTSALITADQKKRH